VRTLRLAKLAAQAEGVRLREMARRQARRVLLALIAGVFAVAFLAAGHVAIAMSLVPRFTPLQAVLIIGGGDLAIALLFGLLATVSRPGVAELAALRVRRDAVRGVEESLTVPALIAGTARLVGGETLIRLISRILSRRRKE